MRSFRNSFVVDAEISKVWKFYTNIKHLGVITPPALELRVVRSTHEELVAGSEVWLTGKLVTRSNWHSKITALEPYTYVDEMITGRFKVWKHAHIFRKLGEARTEVIDEINFELHYGFIGKLFEPYVLSQLGKTFAYREKATKSELNKFK